MNTALDLWLLVGFEAASFVGALVLFFRTRRPRRSDRQRYGYGLRVIMAYAVLVFFYWAAGFYLQGSYTLFGAILYGGTAAGFHVMLLAAIFLFAGIMFSAKAD